MNFIESYFMRDTSLCDDIINHFKNLPIDRKFKGTFYTRDNGKEEERINLDLKDSIDSFLYADDGEICDRYDEHLQECTNKYIEKYPECNTVCKWAIREHVRIQYYRPGGGYKQWHTERSSVGSDRHLVFMTYLNDVTDGGETEFKCFDIKVKSEKGKTVIWPVDWTHTHRGIISPTQDKYIVTGWYSFLL
tara:strand:- start:43 stop:615 length:573 start_codon:yes stop_codon:yes gene_type:complete